MKQKKIRVVWICHFSNEEIQNHLPLWKKIDEYSSWVPNMLKGFENREKFEIHIISPHQYLRRDTNIIIRNIHYHFITYGIPFYHRHWPRFFRFDNFTDFFLIRRKIKAIVINLNPDLINLIGAENAYYSSSVLDFYNKYPVLVVIQGIISEYANKIKLIHGMKQRIRFEEKIFTELKYFCGDADSSDHVARYNLGHTFFILDFPVNEEIIAKLKESDTKYDCVYFGRLSKYKGVEDFIRVIAELKKEIPDIKACIVGSGDTNPLKTLAKESGLLYNIEFVGFLPTQKELFEYVKSSKVVLIPPLFDRVSCTIREAMLLRVPIVAYATGAIPSLNKEEVTIVMVKTGDYHAMAEKTLQLLNNEVLREELTRKAYHHYMKNFSLEASVGLLTAAYQTILNLDQQNQL